MSRCQYYLAQTLDGYIAESDGGLEWLMRFEGEGAVEASEASPVASEGSYERFFAGVGALAMGSATYEFVLGEMSTSWPYAGTPSWVFTSRELPVPDGADVRFANGSVGPAYEEMRSAAGDRNVWVVGGGALAMQFVEEDLLDELHLTIVPVFLGAGIPTFPSRLGRRLRLVGTHAFGNGMVELRYDVLRPG